MVYSVKPTNDSEGMETQSLSYDNQMEYFHHNQKISSQRFWKRIIESAQGNQIVSGVTINYLRINGRNFHI